MPEVSLNSPWLPFGILLMLALFARTIQGSWLAPSAFAGLLWSLYVALPLVATAEHVSSRSVWFLLCLVACLQAGAFFFEDPTAWKLARNQPKQEALTALGDRCLGLSLWFSAAALMGGIFYVARLLRVLDLSASLEGFLGLGALMYGLLLQGEADPWWFRLLRMWIFPSVLLGGFAAAIVHSWKKKLLSLSAFIPSLFVGTAIASRFGTALAIACWVGGYLSMKGLLTRGRFRVEHKFVVAVALIAFAAVAMYAGLWVVRGHEFQGNFSESSAMLRSDLLGYLTVFDHWMRTGEHRPLTFGAYTFAGAFEFLGIRSRERAFNYDEIMLEPGIWSNIYTAFRGLIEDFSFPGSMLLCLIAGAFVGRSYTQVCSGRITSLWTVAAYYVFLLWSPIVSAFNYNAILLALLVGALTMWRSSIRILSAALHRTSGQAASENWT